MWSANGGYDALTTEWVHAVINVPATEAVQILIKGYDITNPFTDINLDDIRLVEYKCGKITILFWSCMTAKLDLLTKGFHF